jgi:ATP-binding cassette subfamily F protein 3
MRDEYPEKTDLELRSTLALFLFGAEDIDKPISTLSGGERARLTLAKLILKKVNLLVMDEPTNHLDIGSCEALENALLAFDGTVIAVSHDRYFINRIATRIVELAPERDTGAIDYPLEDYDSAFDEYMRLREERRAAITEEKPRRAIDARQEYEEKKRENAERRAAEKKIERAKKRVAELEAEIASLDEELFGSAATDYVRAAEIDGRKSEIEEELLVLYELVM